MENSSERGCFLFALDERRAGKGRCGGFSRNRHLPQRLVLGKRHWKNIVKLHLRDGIETQDRFISKHYAFIAR